MQTVLITFLGLGLGPMLVGLLSDLLNGFMAIESLRYALIITNTTTLISIILLFKLKSYQAAQLLTTQSINNR